MTLLSLSPSNLAPRSSRSALALGVNRPLRSRITHDEELRLAARLRALRSELLGVALIEPACRDELDRIAGELASGTLPIDAVVDEPASAPDELHRRFDAFHAAVVRLSGDVDAPEPSRAQPASSAQGTDPAVPATLERALKASLAAAGSIDLRWDCVERLLQHGGLGGSGVPGASSALLPRALAERARRVQGEIDAIVERFISSNQGLVANVVRRYRGLGLSQEDLMQDGNIGLLRAVEKFDHRRARPFGSYAVWWVRDSVRRALAQQGRTIRLPASAIATRYAIGKASRRLAHELGREPSSLELAHETGMAPERIDDLICLSREPLSLDAPRGDDAQVTLGDVLADRTGRSATEHASANESAEGLQLLLADLKPRERHVLSLRFGLNGGGERTLEEIGRSLHLTRERVRQIVAAALDKLQHATRAQGLEL